MKLVEFGHKQLKQQGYKVQRGHFNSQIFLGQIVLEEVIGIDFVGVSDDEMDSWDFWSGNGEPFGSHHEGKWQILVQHEDFTTQIFRALGSKPGQNIVYSVLASLLSPL
ncbi:hypothetical protein HAX54_025059, partial [Datura stramonium]|nr:hypothetical protein [Datura stramonium]